MYNWVSTGLTGHIVHHVCTCEQAICLNIGAKEYQQGTTLPSVYEEVSPPKVIELETNVAYGLVSH